MSDIATTLSEHLEKLAPFASYFTEMDNLDDIPEGTHRFFFIPSIEAWNEFEASFPDQAAGYDEDLQGLLEDPSSKGQSPLFGYIVDYVVENGGEPVRLSHGVSVFDHKTKLPYREHANVQGGFEVALEVALNEDQTAWLYIMQGVFNPTSEKAEPGEDIPGEPYELVDEPAEEPEETPETVTDFATEMIEISTQLAEVEAGKWSEFWLAALEAGHLTEKGLAGKLVIFAPVDESVDRLAPKLKAGLLDKYEGPAIDLFGCSFGLVLETRPKGATKLVHTFVDQKGVRTVLDTTGEKDVYDMERFSGARILEQHEIPSGGTIFTIAGIPVTPAVKPLVLA